ncbi:MAG: multiple sugar transport system permease protein [Actinomycetota bacterium]|nr:multiple sugar transport system permease protein [Actinomycetota bacterium]
MATARVTVPAARRALRRRRSRRHYAGVLAFLSPWVLGFFMFIIYPMLASLYYSFTHYDMLSQPQWVGLSNYRFMFTSDPLFWTSLRNTVWIIAIGVPVQIVFAIAVAWVLTLPQRGRGFYRTIYFVPAMVPTVAATLAFVFLLGKGGPLDTVLGFVHISSPLWFQDPAWSKPGLVLLSLWGVGETMIIFLAALLDVPTHLYEAADIEGASAWQKFRLITLPMISPVIFFAAVIGVIYGFQYFTEAYVAAGAAGGTRDIASNLGYPLNSTLFYGIYLYQQGFAYFHLGYASAMAWILFLIIMACTLVLVRSSKHWVFYQGGFK